MIGTQPRVVTAIPGPQSARLLERQAERESNARTYPRRLPIGIARAAGSYIEDVDGNVFIDFLTGAGVLALGHNEPEVRRGGRAPAADALPRPRLPDRAQGRVHRAPALAASGGDAQRDEDPVLRTGGRERRRRSAEAVQDRDRTRRDRRVPGRIPRQHAQRDGGDRPRLAEGAGRRTSCTACTSSRTRTRTGRRSRSASGVTAGEACAHYFESVLTDPIGGVTTAGRGDHGDRAGGRRRHSGADGVRARRAPRHAELDIPLIVDEIQTGCGPDRHVVLVRAPRDRARRDSRVEGARRDRHADRRRLLQQEARRLGAGCPHRPRSAATSSRSPPVSRR